MPSPIGEQGKSRPVNPGTDGRPEAVVRSGRAAGRQLVGGHGRTGAAGRDDQIHHGSADSDSVCRRCRVAVHGPGERRCAQGVPPAGQPAVQRIGGSDRTIPEARKRAGKIAPRSCFQGREAGVKRYREDRATLSMSSTRCLYRLLGNSRSSCSPISIRFDPLSSRAHSSKASSRTTASLVGAAAIWR
jgi:hypothetical protein